MRARVCHPVGRRVRETCGRESRLPNLPNRKLRGCVERVFMVDPRSHAELHHRAGRLPSGADRAFHIKTRVHLAAAGIGGRQRHRHPADHSQEQFGFINSNIIQKFYQE